MINADCVFYNCCGEKMKKLLIGMLLLIPIIVILIVSATASIVQGANIAVESVVLYKPSPDGSGIVKIDGPILAYISDAGIQLTALVYPTHASDKTVIWTVENEQVTLGASVLSVSADGYVSYLGLGTADVVATASGNIKARAKILVTSSDVLGISIAQNVPETFSVGDRLKLEAALYPADVETSQRYLLWEVVSGDAVTVDQNGIITAQNSGAAVVRASLKNPPASLAQEKRSSQITVNVQNKPQNVVFNASALTHVGESISLLSLVNDAYADKNILTFETTAGEIAGNILSVDLGDDENQITATVKAKAGLEEVGAVEITFKRIAFLNSDMWARIQEDGNKVYLTLGSAGIAVEMRSVFENAQVFSSNPEVAALENGYLVAKSVGDTTLTAHFGDVSECLNFTVLPPVYNVDLVFDNADDELGVEMTRVLGKRTYEDGAVTNQIKFEISSIYTVVGGENKILSKASEIAPYLYLIGFEIDGASTSNGFSISSAGVLTTGSGNAASIKAKVKHPLYQSIEVCSVYNAKFIENGVNVGLISKAQKELWQAENKTERQIEDAINETALAGFDYVNALAKTQYDASGRNDGNSIVLHSDVIMNKVDKHLYCSLYGNGATLRQTREDASDYDAYYNADGYATLRAVVDNITIQNIKVRAAKSVAVGQSLYEYRYAGNGIVVDGRQKYFPNGAAGAERLTNININYVIAENAYYCVYVAAADVNICGAIIRNSGGQSLYVNTSVCDVNTLQGKKLMNAVVNLKNSVFSNAINMSIGILTEDLDDYYDEMETVTVDGQTVTRPRFVSYFQNVTQSVLNMEGFCEIYNWKTAKELDFEFVSEYGIDGDWVGGIVRSLIEDEANWATLTSMLRGIEINNIMQKDREGVPHFQLAVGNVGVHYPISGYIPEESKQTVGLTGKVVMDISSFANLAGSKGAYIQYPLEFYCYDSQNPRVGPDDDYSANAALFARMKEN